MRAVPETQHLDDLLACTHAIHDPVRMMNDLAQTGLATFWQDATEQRMFSQQLQFFHQLQAEVLGSGGIVAGQIPNQPGEILGGDFGCEDLESHDGKFFSSSSSGTSLP